MTHHYHIIKSGSDKIDFILASGIDSLAKKRLRSILRWAKPVKRAA